MSEEMLTEKQMAHLLKLSGNDLDAQLSMFAGQIPQKETEDLREAIRGNDMGRAQMLAQNMQGYLNSTDFEKLQAALEMNQLVRKVTDATRAYNILKQKEKSEKLTPQETQFLSQEAQLRNGVDFLLKMYPEAKEETQTMHDQNREQQLHDTSTADKATLNEPKQVNQNEGEQAQVDQNEAGQERVTGSENKQENVSSGAETAEKDFADNAPQSDKLPREEADTKFTVTHPIDHEALQEGYVDSTVPDYTQATDINDINFSPETEKQPYQASNEGETATASYSDAPVIRDYEMTPESEHATDKDRLSEKPGMYRGFKDNDKYDSFTGDSDFEKENIQANNNQMAARDGKSVGPGNLADLQPKGEYGFAGDWQFANPKKMDWLPLFEKTVIDPMKKFGGEKEIGDLIVNVMYTVALMPVEFAAEALKQRRENKKESAKRLKDNRENAIDSNLKNRGLGRNDLVSRLAHEAKDWILNDPRYANLPEKGPFTKYEKAMLEKRDFAKSLPRKENGDLDWGKMSKSQQNKYGRYVSAYALSDKWMSYACEMMGVQIKRSEVLDQIKAASQMKVADPLLAKAAQVQAAENAATPKVVSPTVAPTRSEPERTDRGETETPTPAHTAPGRTGRSATEAPTLAHTTPGRMDRGETETPTPAYTTPERTGRSEPGAPTPAYTEPERAGMSDTVAAPSAVRSKAEVEAQKELEDLKKLEPLADVKISGTPKNPKITLPDGTVLAADNATKEQLEEEARRLERRARELKERAEKTNENMRSVNRSRTGQQQMQQNQGRTRGPERGM